MSEKLGVLFLHHDAREVALHNLRTLVKQNPDAMVITVSANKELPGGYTLEATPHLKKFHAENIRRGSDWLVCSWFLQRREKADKWWIVEWDTFCRMSARDYYAPVWSFPFVASSVRLPYREPGWAWFKGVRKLPEEYQDYATGAVPFLYLVSDAALTAICSTLLATPIVLGNGELRFATAASKCGFAPCGYSPPNDRITWRRWRSVTKGKGIFHPVKHLVDYIPPESA